MQGDRSHFYHNHQIFVSAGIIPYTCDQSGKYHFMFQRLTSPDRKWTYEDFGGKSQACDQSIQDIAVRECREETNFSEPFTSDFLTNQIADPRTVVYRIPAFKYMLYVVYVPPELLKLNLAQFGTSNDEHPRVLEWLSYVTIMAVDDLEFHPRLGGEFKTSLPLILASASASVSTSTSTSVSTSTAPQ
jgi:hypothetical protein